MSVTSTLRGDLGSEESLAYGPVTAHKCPQGRTGVWLHRESRRERETAPRDCQARGERALGTAHVDGVPWEEVAPVSPLSIGIGSAF